MALRELSCILGGLPNDDEDDDDDGDDTENGDDDDDERISVQYVQH